MYNKADYQMLQRLDKAIKGIRKLGLYRRRKESLSDAELMILFAIAFSKNSDEQKLSDVAKRLQVTLPAVTHKIGKLVSEGYLRKDPSERDMRVYYIRLTEFGLKYVDEVVDRYYRPLIEVADFVGKDDLFNLIRILEKIQKIRYIND